MGMVMSSAFNDAWRRTPASGENSLMAPDVELLTINARIPIVSIMAQMNISIPDKLKAWVESRVADGTFASSSDYLRDLVRRDQRAEAALENLRMEILAGIESGVSELNPFAQLDGLRARAQAKTASEA